MSQSSLDVIVPLYNEADIVSQLHKRLRSALLQLPLASRIIYVDDGSRDSTVEVLKANLEFSDRVEILQFSRNFGQPAAILAGMNCADADAVIVMDGDLQDPPELIPPLVQAWQAGHEVVIAQRPRRAESSWLRGWGFRSFHWLFRRLSELEIPEHCGTFCLLSRAVADSIRRMPETQRFFPGLRAWVGFDPHLISYERPVRQGGDPKQTMGRLVRYAGDAILGFSRRPVQALLFAGLGMALLAGIFLAASLAGCIGILPDWGPYLLAAAISGLAAGQFLSTGLIVELLFRIQEQVKQRPAYQIKDHFRSQVARRIKAA